MTEKKINLLGRNTLPTESFRSNNKKDGELLVIKLENSTTTYDIKPSSLYLYILSTLLFCSAIILLTSTIWLMVRFAPINVILFKNEYVWDHNLLYLITSILTTFCALIAWNSQRSTNKILLPALILLLMISFSSLTIALAINVHNRHQFWANLRHDNKLVCTLHESLHRTFHLKESKTIAAWDAINRNFKCCGIIDQQIWKHHGLPLPASCLDDFGVAYNKSCIKPIIYNINSQMCISSGFGIVTCILQAITLFQTIYIYTKEKKTIIRV